MSNAIINQKILKIAHFEDLVKDWWEMSKLGYAQKYNQANPYQDPYKWLKS